MGRSFIEKLQAETNGLYLIGAEDEGRKCWYYLDVDKLKLSILESRVKESSSLNLEEYGRVVVSGWGVEPPALVKERAAKYGAAYSADSDLELQKYYDDKSDVFFLTGTSEGKPCYYYVAVNGRMVDEFNRVCASGQTPDLADFGNIIESGWGLPSDTIRDYMWEKYQVTTPIIETPIDNPTIDNPTQF